MVYKSRKNKRAGKMKAALTVVDMQRDFMPRGSLAVPNADKIIPTLNDYVHLFQERGELVVFTRDWHPKEHISFVTEGGAWPEHCVQGTAGAQIEPTLSFPSLCLLVSKATSPGKEAYSGFDATDLANMLKALGVTRLFVGGVATDYCVKSTVLDAIKSGFETLLLNDAIRGVDLKPGDSERAVEEMKKAGARAVSFGDVKKMM